MERKEYENVESLDFNGTKEGNRRPAIGDVAQKRSQRERYGSTLQWDEIVSAIVGGSSEM